MRLGGGLKGSRWIERVYARGVERSEGSRVREKESERERVREGGGERERERVREGEGERGGGVRGERMGEHQHSREISATRALHTNFSVMGMSWERVGWPVGLGRSKMVLEDVDM